MKRKYIKWGIVIAFMIGIFIFSNQPAEISDGNSRFVILVLKHIGVDLDSFLGNLANFIVRKAAHFTEYLILYILLYEAFKEDFDMRKSLVSSLIVLVLYACSDEVHQLFVPGRTGRIRDVLIDTSGAVIAMISIYFKNRSRQKRNSRAS